jgi:tetratricopeptide (TPR) repeat protein
MKSTTLLFSLLILGSPHINAAETEAAANLKACDAALEEGDADKALPYADAILKHNPLNREALLCKGHAHVALEQYDAAVVAFKATEKLSATPTDHMVGLVLTANALKETQKYEEALGMYRQSLAIAQTEKNKQFERINLNEIGDTQKATNQVEAALESYLAGQALAANDNERADGYGRIASSYSALGKHDLAIEHQVKATVLEGRAGDMNHYANAYLELGRIYTAAKDYERAEKAIDKVVKLSKENGGPYWEAKSYYYMAMTKSANGQSPEAKALLADAQRISEQIGAQSLSDEIKQSLSKLNQKL